MCARRTGGHDTIAEIGEKGIIERFLRPLFNPGNDVNGVGDDCAALEVPFGSLALLSTDRVPADLISFRAGVLDYFGLGRYLAVLNFSDIAACGGVPQALLLNFGLPSDLPVSALLDICRGIMSVVDPLDAKVMGGDMSLSSEISISATAFGHVEKDKVLRRSGARAGDSVFVSGEIGMTPVALQYCLNPDAFGRFGPEEVGLLKRQFSAPIPMIELGRRLAASGRCAAAMDNTDGLWQSLSELSRESEVAVVLEEDLIDLGQIVRKFAAEMSIDPFVLGFGAGADFSLVGMLRGWWTTEDAKAAFGDTIRIVGHSAEGSGVLLKSKSGTGPFNVPGWDYFIAPRDSGGIPSAPSGSVALPPLKDDDDGMNNILPPRAVV